MKIGVLGSLPSISLDWRINRRFTYTAIYSHFFAGRFLQETPPGKDVTRLDLGDSQV